MLTAPARSPSHCIFTAFSLIFHCLSLKSVGQQVRDVDQRRERSRLELHRLRRRHRRPLSLLPHRHLGNTRWTVRIPRPGRGAPLIAVTPPAWPAYLHPWIHTRTQHAQLFHTNTRTHVGNSSAGSSTVNRGRTARTVKWRKQRGQLKSHVRERGCGCVCGGCAQVRYSAEGGVGDFSLFADTENGSGYVIYKVCDAPHPHQ